MNVPAIAQTEQQTPPAALKPARERPISKPVRQAIELLESGECRTQKAAAARVGITEEWLCKSLRKFNVQAFIARKRAENISRAALRASWKLGELVDAQSEHVALRATERVLEQSGDLRVQQGGVSVSVNTTISAGYVIDLAPQSAAPQIVEIEANKPDD